MVVSVGLGSEMWDDVGARGYSFRAYSNLARRADGEKCNLVLEGSVPGNGELRIVMTTFAMPLNNSGDRITLLDPQQTPVSVVEYSGGEVASGMEIRFDN